MVSAVSLRIYKTNRALWVILSLVVLLLSSYDIQEVFEVFAGHGRVEGLLSFEFVAPLIISVTLGWLAQCATVMVYTWIREKCRPKH